MKARTQTFMDVPEVKKKPYRAKYSSVDGVLVLSSSGVVDLLGQPEYEGVVYGVGTRMFAAIGPDWADSRTGTIYNGETLRCRSSDTLYLMDHPKLTGRKIPKRKEGV